MTKPRIAVLRGGPSSEYEVSLKTGEAVLNSLKKRDVTVEDIIVTRQGEWMKDGFVKSPESILLATDIVFIALHGIYGEDGTVQRILERLNIPYTGSKPYASAMAMNKILTKEHLRNAGIKLASHLRVKKEGTDVARTALAISTLFGPNYIVKPITGGSSYGVAVANGPDELRSVLRSLLKTEDEVMVEERILGREATVGVIERFREHSLYSLPPIEIVPPQKAAFFDTESKYCGATDEICPGRFTFEEKKALEEAAAKVHQELELSQYSRSDFIVSPKGIYFLEVNTIPGLTNESLIPKALEAVGCSYDDFVWHLVTDKLGSF